MRKLKKVTATLCYGVLLTPFMVIVLLVWAGEAADRYMRTQPKWAQKLYDAVEAVEAWGSR